MGVSSVWVCPPSPPSTPPTPTTTPNYRFYSDGNALLQLREGNRDFHDRVMGSLM